MILVLQKYDNNRYTKNPLVDICLNSHHLSTRCRIDIERRILSWSLIGVKRTSLSALITPGYCQEKLHINNFL